MASKLTIPKIKAILDERGVAYSPKAKKDELLRLLEEIVSEEPKAKAKPSVTSSDISIVDFLNNGPRQLVVVNFDDKEVDLDINCNGRKEGNCANFAFEYSTGTSNVYNFKNIFLPILRQDSDGWLHKDKNADIRYSECLTDYFSTLFLPRKLTEECQKEMKEFLKEFISRFGCWKQIQISAALAKPDDLWFNTLFFRTLRETALTCNFCIYDSLETLEEELRKMDEEEIKAKRIPISQIKDDSSIKGNMLIYCKYLKSKPIITKIKEIKSLGLERAIGYAYERRVSKKFKNGFLYRRAEPITPMTDFVIPPFIRDDSVNFRVVNDWLLSRGALCERQDKQGGKSDEILEEQKKLDKAIKDLQERRIDPSVVSVDKYFGWLRCD